MANVNEVVKANNKILNLLDPPKDLADGNLLNQRNHGEALEPILTQLFWSEGRIPEGFKSVGDTKLAIKRNLGAGSESAAYSGKPLTQYLLNKSNRLKVLREKHNSGHDARPSGLYVAQDSGPGPSTLIKDPNIIITPGTIMDPASKTKEGATYLVAEYGSLPLSYIQQLNMGNLITGPITMEDIPTNGAKPRMFRVKIPTTIGGGYTIDALLKADTFKKVETIENPNPDGRYFDGNPEKNQYIQGRFNRDYVFTATEDEKNTIKKYILVKELGDTLQVVWLKYILDQNGTYKSENTLLLTGDTVVWYRAIINKVPVLITYMGESTIYRAEGNDEPMIAAFRKTICDQLISDNESVIATIEDVYNSERGRNKEWINGNRWEDAQYNAAREYLRKLLIKLRNLNKDAFIFLDKVPSIDGAKAAAARYHFANPFIKKADWKTNNKITSILPDGTIPFSAKSFVASSIVANLANERLFKSVADVAAGGGQTGGAERRSIDTKREEAQLAVTQELQTAYFNTCLSEWQLPGVIRLVLPDDILRRVAAAKLTRDSPPVEGNADDFTNNRYLYSIFSNNSTAVVGMPDNNVLYLLIRDFFPEVFTYAACMKKGLEEMGADRSILRKFSKVDFDLKTKYKLEYQININDRMLIFAVDQRENVPINADVVYIPAPATAEDTLAASKQAIFLATKFLTFFQYLPSQEVADFLDYCYRRILTESEKEQFNVGLAIENVQYQNISMHENNPQEGGSEVKTVDLTALYDRAMEINEIYYGLALKATYEDRTLTDSEVVDELNKINKEIGLSRNIPSKNRTPSNIKRLLSNISAETPVVVGGRHFKKTKKKKASRKRQTRRVLKRISKK